VVNGAGGTCTIAGYVKIAESPFGTPVFYVGAVLGLLGLFALFGAMPPRSRAAGPPVPRRQRRLPRRHPSTKSRDSEDTMNERKIHPVAASSPGCCSGWASR